MNMEVAIRRVNNILDLLKDNKPCHAIGDLHYLVEDIQVEGILGWGIRPEVRCGKRSLNPCMLTEPEQKMCCQEV